MNNNQTYWIINANVVLEQEVLKGGALKVVGDKIDAVYHQGDAAIPSSKENCIDANGSWLLPGFIDIHVHGGFGCDFMDAKEESIETIARFHSTHGTTAIVATSMTALHDDISSVLDSVHSYQQNEMPYAQVVGVHLEGPFINPNKVGAQNPAFVSLPRVDWMQEWNEQYPGLIKILSLAPEREGALELIAWLRDNGIVASAAHTDANYEQMEAARLHGLSHSVHMYNAMSPLHHREPGTVGAILTMNDVSAEIIADGIHVHPVCTRLLVAMKQQDNLVMITDAMSATGLEDGIYQLGGQDVLVKGGVARLKVGDSLAGSTLTTIRGFRHLVQDIGLTVPEASRRASLNPAKVLRLNDTIGSIRGGKQADLLLVSEDLELQQVIIKGKQIHS
ncbi:N-acetylglucosamine-6-phosphate deacetylase [Paenibacillus sp. N1-5-1-14]|uniref:N-acetylglucosamine-6-phosphate deacetylase n=1 Tax=Paenibacillus radicibacter TaxID=2972488 RepID=UPI002158F054|nr:N-acetylglucosamine-6-phosphate deacetylase [Paenibacillus radicibacter]MCR8643689.1 N-acetylglucosamine-6-phosphate deacetylase [Paenibacillus radicibacter]